MLKYLSLQQTANAAWLLMLSAALVLGAKSFSDSSPTLVVASVSKFFTINL